MQLLRAAMCWGILFFSALWLLVVGDAGAFRRGQLGINHRSISYSSTDAAVDLVPLLKASSTSIQDLSDSLQAYDIEDQTTGFLTERRKPLHKRAPPIKSFQDCLQTGNNIIEAIKCQSSAPSTYNDFADLQKNGYVVTKEELSPSRLFEGVGELQGNLQAPKDGWMKWSISHYDLKSTSSGGVEFDIVTHAGSGVIFVKNAYGAISPQNPGGPPLNKLRQLSDIAYLCLAEHARLKSVALKFNYYAVKEVVNPSSRARALDIMKASTKAQLSAAGDKWPGYVMKIDGSTQQMGEGNKARALLGTPSGIAAGYILAARQPKFQKRTITSLTIRTLFAAGASDPAAMSVVQQFDLVITIGDLP